SAVGQVKWLRALACHCPAGGSVQLISGEYGGLPECNHRVQSHDLSTGAARDLFAVHNTQAMAVSPDGMLFHSDGDLKTVRVFDLATGRMRAEWKGGVNSWKWGRPSGIVAMSEFVCIAAGDCVHIIPRCQVGL